MSLLQPILHRDAYTRLVEQQVVDYLREAVFMPFVLLLNEHGVSVRANGTGWVSFPSHLAPSGVARRDLPQVPSDRLGEFILFLANQGIACEECEMPAEALRPTQEGYWTHKLQPYDPAMPPVLVAYNFTILDGHHRWYSAYLESPRAVVPLLRFKADIKTLMEACCMFDGLRRENESSAVLAALRSGTLHYGGDRFTGEFNSLVSRELRSLGAVFDKADRSFVLPTAKMPYFMRGAVSESVNRGRETHAAVLGFIAAILANLDSAPDSVDATRAGREILLDLTNQFDRTVKTLSDVPEFTDEERQRLSEELTENVALSIKGFIKERLPELRHRVEENLTHHSGDLGRLSRVLESEFGFAKRRAAFIAERETALLVAKYRQIRYEGIGSQGYIWETRKDERVRPGHAHLQGRSFEWSDPPIADPATGRRCHPGEDFGCRCVPRALINLPVEA